MADVAIKGPAQSSAPLTYTLPDAAEFVPRSITATFNGASATIPFYPCLILTDASGLEVARIPTSGTVAAGGSAEVTWFPGVAQQSKPAASAYLLTDLIYSHTFTGTSSYTMQWPHFQTTDSSVFATNAALNFNTPYSNSVNDIAVLLLQPGAYVIQATILWATGTVAMYGQINIQFADYSLDANPGAAENTSASTVPWATTAGALATVSVRPLTVLPGNQGMVSLLASGATATNYTITGAFMLVHYLGGGIGNNLTVY